MLNVWRKHFVAILLLFYCAIFPIAAFASQGNDIAYRLALSKQLSDVDAAVEFYLERGFEPIWVDRSRDARKRLGALFAAFEDSAAHGLPQGLFDASEPSEMISVPYEHPLTLARSKGKSPAPIYNMHR